MAQSAALEVFTVRHNERSPMLVGQKGLRARIPLPRATVIGEYFGRELLEAEFDDMYALSSHVEVEVPLAKLNYFCNLQMDEAAEADAAQLVEQPFRIVMDGLNTESEIKAMVIYMNALCKYKM